METDENTDGAPAGGPFRYPAGCVLLFARAPEAGRVKTRLEPALGREATLVLHREMIRDVWERAHASRLCPLQLWVSGPPDHPFFRELCPDARIHRQQGGDLGRRMFAAAEQGLVDHEFVILLGADCPSVDSAYLAAAAERLQAGDEAVLGPADDGGYVLLGLRRVDRALFSDMPWGGGEVLPRTRERLTRCGFRWSELAPRWDVDRPEDLDRLAELAGWRRLEDGRVVTERDPL